MAEALLDIESPEEDANEGPALTLLDVMGMINIVPHMVEDDVNRIGSEALREFEIDKESCKDWLERYDRSQKIAMQTKEEKTFPWRGASNVKFPLLTQAAIQFQARAYPAIIDGANLVKGKVLGKDPDGKKRERADRIGAHMTWQLLNMPGWEEDTDRLLLRLPIVGCVFRKSWYDTVSKRAMSETLAAKDFIVNYMTQSLEKAPRYTHIQRYYPHEIEEFILSELWVKVPYEGENGDDPTSLVEVYEQHRLIDMDDDGYPEPYVVTFTKEGAVARICACFDHDGVTIKAGEETKKLSEIMENGQIPNEQLQIVRIERKQYFTKYGFIPSPDGSFYDMGFGTLLESISASIDTILNQLIDAGTLANMQGGFLASGVKIKGGNMRFTPGEWKRVEGPTAGALRDNIVPLQLPGPSTVLFQLLGMLIEAAKDITSVQDILTGSQDSQTAPTTALALIEQGQKVFTAIYKRIYCAFGQELKILFGLNRDFLDEQQYFALTDEPGEIGRADYQDKDLDVEPVSDPTAVNDMQKMAKVQVLMSHNGDPLINQIDIRKREFEAAGIDNIPELFKVPPPPPDPKILADGAKLANDRDETKSRVRMNDAATAASLIATAKGAYELGAVLGDPSLEAFAREMFKDAEQLASSIINEMEANGAGPETQDPEAGGVPVMAGEAGNEGIPPVPDGFPGPVGEAMGGGGADVSGLPAQGGAPDGAGGIGV